MLAPISMTTAGADGGHVARANRGRVAAVQALVQAERGAHVDEILQDLAPEYGRDRALSWFLALGVLRRRSHVDASLRPHLHQPLASLDPEVRATLRVGTFERLFADTPPHAAVSQAVEVIKAVGRPRASGLINAVVRRVGMPRDLGLAESLDHPAWLVDRWIYRYGEEATRAWCLANNTNPPLFATVRHEDVVSTLRRAELVVEPVEIRGRTVPGCVHISGHRGPVTALPGFLEGSLIIQDAAAAAVSDLVGDARGARVLDACAAPGGKSFRLAMGGAEVLAVDRSEDRLRLLHETGERLGLSLPARVHDWTQGPLEGVQPFDAVLVDAPCTALGTSRRNPEVRWRRQLVDVLAMPAIQGAILQAAATHVRPGGALVYAVCSPEPEEGEGVVRGFLHEHPGFSQEDELLTAPPSVGEDAFFAVRLRRAP